MKIKIKITPGMKKAINLLIKEGGMYRSWNNYCYYSDLTNTNINSKTAEKLLPYCTRYSMANSLDNWYELDLTKLNK